MSGRSTRFRWLLWLTATGVLAAIWLFPVSYRSTRVVSIVLAIAVWFGLIALVWRYRGLRIALLGVTGFVAGFLALPASETVPTEALRGDYISCLRRYEGVSYFWGGETARGIDCSGLVRRGLIDALVRGGVRAGDAGLIRKAIGLWWHDCSASALGDQYRGLTMRLRDAASLNTLDHLQILPGDLAVTESGVHVMAYLGNNQWIEADPGPELVLIVTAPSADNSWFDSPMKIVRWSVLR